MHRRLAIALFTGSTLIPLLAAAQRPAVAYHSLLGITLFTNGPEVMALGSQMDVAFAPAGNFAGRVVYRSGDRVLADLPTRVTQRVGTMARIVYRTITVKLGAEDGPRSIEVYIEGEKVGALDFTLTKTTGGDAFAPTTSWRVDGPWTSHAFFAVHTDAARQQRVRFTYWSTTSELGGVPKGNLDLVMKRGATVLATALSREVNSTTPIRKEQELRLANGQVFMLQDLASMNGPYVVELRHGNRVVKSFRGEIANGQFVPHPLSAVPAPDVTHFLSPRTISDDGGMIHPDLFSWVAMR